MECLLVSFIFDNSLPIVLKHLAVMDTVRMMLILRGTVFIYLNFGALKFLRMNFEVVCKNYRF